MREEMAEKSLRIDQLADELKRAQAQEAVAREEARQLASSAALLERQLGEVAEANGQLELWKLQAKRLVQRLRTGCRRARDD
jgi:hypothetical protein